METLRQIEQQIRDIRGLREIVQSMRTLASTYLKRAEEQLHSVRLYHETVVQALSVALGAYGKGVRDLPAKVPDTLKPSAAPEAIVLFATEQGLCGRFNEVMVDALRRCLAERPHARTVVLGQRGRGVAENAGIPVFRSYPAVTSPDGIPGAIRRTAEELYRLYAEGTVSAIYLLHAVHRAVGRFDENFERVLPLDVLASGMTERRQETVESREERKAHLSPLSSLPSIFRQPPLTYVPKGVLRRRLVEEYYFIRFYWAFVETVASENSVRLQSMEAARANIEDTLADLESRRRILRQNEITEELMDVISGAEAVTGRTRRG